MSGVNVSTIEDGRVLRLELANGKGNILDMATMREIKHALDGHEDDQRLKLVMLCSSGKAFSYGVSVAEHTKELVGPMLETFHTLLRRIASYPVPVATAVKGACLGGAFELALCTHFVFATRGASFACPEIKLGVYPPVLAAIGADRLGAPLAERMLLTGEAIDVDVAERSGWLTMALDEGDPEEAAIEWYRRTLAGLSACALRRSNAAIRQGSVLNERLGRPLYKIERSYIDQLMKTRDANEGITAFMEKRKPVWEDM